MDDSIESRYGCTRRQAVAGGAVATSSLLGGCLNPLKQFFGLSSANQVSLRIATFPSNDWDERATRITKQLMKRLESVGIDANMYLLPPKQLRRRVLNDREFDAYVATMPLGRDPDFLRPLLGSTYATRLGWQNPFGFTDMSLDELLDEQRRQSGSERVDTVGEILGVVANEQPFIPLVTDHAIAGIATDRFEGWDAVPARDPTWLLEVDLATVTGNGATNRELRIATFDRWIADRLNPLTPRLAEFDILTSLLYDPLARHYDGEIRPWLAKSWSFEENELTVTLRSDLRWHDGTRLTAEDVRFTYRFLSDTSLGSGETRLPAPRFQSQASVVQAIDVDDDRTLRMTVDAGSEVASHALTAPLLPEHIWDSRTDVVDAAQGFTQAIQTDNTSNVVGCGPMALEERQSEQELRLSRADNHPLNRDDGSDIADRFGPMAFSKLRFRVTTPANIITELDEGTADITPPTLQNGHLSQVRNNPDIDSVRSSSRTLYHVGFNCRRKPFRNPKFRRAVAHVIDKNQIAESIFDGYADPVSTPIVEQSWVPEDLQWNGSDPEVPFAGSNGSLDTATARENFRAAGFSYTDDGRLVY